MTKIYKPINDQVLLKAFQDEEQEGRIIRPDIGNERPIKATVIATSEGIYNFHTDKIIPHQVKVGDVVFLPKMGAQVIDIKGVEHYICQANQLMLKEIDE